MGTVCLGGVVNNITYSIYEDEGEYVATVTNHTVVQTETFPDSSPAKMWVNRMINNDCCSEKNEIDRFGRKRTRKSR